MLAIRITAAVLLGAVGCFAVLSLNPWLGAAAIASSLAIEWADDDTDE